MRTSTFGSFCPYTLPDVALSGRVVSELGPEVCDVNIDEVLFFDPVRSPYPLDELAAGVGELGSLGQGIEQVDLGTGQLHRGLPHLDRSEERRVGKECRSRW